MCLSFCTNHTRAKNDFSSLIIMDPFAQIVHTLSLLSSSFYASILPTASFMIERYRSNGFPCFRGIKTGGWRRYSLMSLKAF